MIDLAPADLALVRRLVQQHLPGRRVQVFGSRSAGRAKPFSDLDLAVVDDAGLSGEALADLRAALDDSELPIRVDLLTWSDAPPSLRAAIEASGAPLFESTSPSSTERV